MGETGNDSGKRQPKLEEIVARGSWGKESAKARFFRRSTDASTQYQFCTRRCKNMRTNYESFRLINLQDDIQEAIRLHESGGMQISYGYSGDDSREYRN